VAAFCEHNHEPSGSIQVRISRQTLLHGVGSYHKHDTNPNIL